jgi:hypothetical protein
MVVKKFCAKLIRASLGMECSKTRFALNAFSFRTPQYKSRFLLNLE